MQKAMELTKHKAKNARQNKAKMAFEMLEKEMEVITKEQASNILAGEGQILRDPSGNIIFISVGNIPVTHPSGDSATLLVGNVFANDGTQIEVYSNTGGGSTGWDTDCHGVSFTDGKYWVNNDQVTVILSGDCYAPVSNSYNSGDVVVYYDSYGNAVHSATISSTGLSGTIVYGQGGLETENHYDTIENAYPSYASYKVYRNNGDRELNQTDYDAFVANGYKF